ncbi:LicD family protein [Lysinibacillus fusiformis]|uniref:LicD family protein n=1 Tax=Lysinibacillus fusiformis TaxID=28031 RepID=UPI0005028A94|nr:LicD family protein [Lysinibacillus fusiformis]KGA82428.1 hypothetical protein KQ41_07975 [Lysinibacillus fusiformis]
MKKNIIIFGASNGGLNYIKNQKDYNILAIVDNNKLRWGQKLLDYYICPPSEINCYPYDFIVITSMYYKQITQQLIEEYNIDERFIICAPKTLMKSTANPFMDDCTINFAHNFLKTFHVEMSLLNIPYFIDFGTLLGFKREGDFIAWDDDIDITVPSEFSEKLFRWVKEFFEKEIFDSVKWHISTSYNEEMKLLGVDISFTSEIYKEFDINIGVFYVKDGIAYQIMNHAPAEHFVKQDFLQVRGFNFAIPNKAEEYLTYTYGNWEIPKKVTTFQTNTLTFKEPVGIQTKTLK